MGVYPYVHPFPISGIRTCLKETLNYKIIYKTVFKPRHHPEDISGQIWLKFGINGVRVNYLILSKQFLKFPSKTEKLKIFKKSRMSKKLRKVLISQFFDKNIQTTIYAKIHADCSGSFTWVVSRCKKTSSQILI